MWDVIGTGLIAGIIAAGTNLFISILENKLEKEEMRNRKIENITQKNNRLKELVSKFISQCYLTEVYEEALRDPDHQVKLRIDMFHDLSNQTTDKHIPKSAWKAIERSVVALDNQREKAQRSLSKLEKLQVLIRLELDKKNKYSKSIDKGTENLISDYMNNTDLIEKHKKEIIESLKNYIDYSLKVD